MDGPPPQPPSIPAGWYADPDNPAGHRYWDGIRWTEQRSAPGGANLRIAAGFAGLVGFVFLWMGVSEALDTYAWATDGIVATGIIVAHGEGNIIGEFTEVEVATESGETVRVMLGGTVGSVGQAVELTYLPDVDYLPDVKEARPGDWTDDSWLYYLPLVLFAGVAFMVMTVLYRKARVIDAGGDRKEH